jgi:hypothetical protein
VKRRRAEYGGTCRWPRRMSHRPTGAAAAREVLLFVGKARTSSSAPPFSRTSSRNARWAKLAKRTTAELDGRPSSNRPAPKRTAPRYPRPGRPNRGPAARPHRPDPRPVRRVHRPASTPGNAAGGSPRPLTTEVHSTRHGSATRGRSGWARLPNRRPLNWLDLFELGARYRDHALRTGARQGRVSMTVRIAPSMW